jgi:uroporphyrinogen decarboxylase
MDGRERLLVALEGREPDRVPRALNFYRVDVGRLAPPGEYHDGLVDIRFVRFPPSPEDEELGRLGRSFPYDTRLGTFDQVTTYARWGYRPQEPALRNPLARACSLDDLRSFPFPDIRDPYHVAGLAEQVQDLHARGLAAGGNLPHLGGELFETAWRLRGLEAFLMDMVERPEWAHFMLDRLADMACRNAETLARAGADVLFLGDDVGMPRSMMVGPAMWRTYFKPRMERIIRAARAIKRDMRVLFHSDGYFEPIIGDLIEIGVDGINPLQPDHMDASRIRERYGPGLVLWGTVGHQGTFSHNTPHQIRQEVKHRIDTLGRAGLVLCPAYDIGEPDIPWANIAAFLDAVEMYG